MFQRLWQRAFSIAAKRYHRLCSKSHSSVRIPQCSTLIVRCTNLDMASVVSVCSLLFCTHWEWQQFFLTAISPSSTTVFLMVNCKQTEKTHSAYNLSGINVSAIATNALFNQRILKLGIILMPFNRFCQFTNMVLLFWVCRLYTALCKIMHSKY